MKYGRGKNPKSRNGFKKGHPNFNPLKIGLIKKGERRGMGTEFKKEENLGWENKNWKGEKSSYTAKHQWIRRHHGKPMMCEHCKSTSKKMYHWANKSNNYKHDISDWMRLCVSCHKIYDLRKTNKVN